MLNSFSTTSTQTLGQMAKNFRWMSDNGLTFLFTAKKISSPRTGRLLFWRSLLKTFDKRPLFSAHCPWMNGKSYFFFWIFVLKMFLWTGGMHFLQSRQKRLARRPGNFNSLSENDTNFFFFQNKKYFPDMFFGTRRMQFRQPLKKFRQQAEEDCSTSKNARRGTQFLEVFFQNGSYGQVEWMHFGKPDEKSSREDRKTHAHCPKLKKDI